MQSKLPTVRFLDGSVMVIEFNTWEYTVRQRAGKRARARVRLLLNPGGALVFIAAQNAKGDVIASRTQIPLKLAWAITIHKSQGTSRCSGDPGHGKGTSDACTGSDREAGTGSGRPDHRLAGSEPGIGVRGRPGVRRSFARKVAGRSARHFVRQTLCARQPDRPGLLPPPQAVQPADMVDYEACK